MPEIKYKLNDDGEPVCSGSNCPTYGYHGYSECSTGEVVVMGDDCTPGLREQRDEARRERDELQVFVCDEIVIWQDERNSNTKDAPKIAEELGWDHLVEFQRNSTGELKKVFRSDIKTDCLYDKWRKINGINS